MYVAIIYACIVNLQHSMYLLTSDCLCCYDKLKDKSVTEVSPCKHCMQVFYKACQD